MPRVAPLNEESRVIDGVKIVRITRPCPLTDQPYDSWTTDASLVTGYQGKTWLDRGWSRTASPAQRMTEIVGMIRVRGPEPTDAEKVAEHVAEIRLSNPGLADQIEAIAAKKLPAKPDGQLFDPGKVSVSLAAIGGPPSGSYLVPADIDAYVLRHSRGEAGGFGTVKPYAELSDDERFCPPKFGHCAESSAAIETGHGLVISAYDVWQPDRPMVRKGDGIVIVSLLVPGRPTETTVASTRDAIGF